MQRYTTKHFWRMKESEQGEFVRYKYFEQLACEYKAMYDIYKEEQEKKRKAHALVGHLKVRVYVLYCIVMAVMWIVVGKLIVWSLGIL